MIFNICPRALKYTVTLNGAPGETISYTGTASGSVVLDAHGAGTIADVKRGTYAFTGSVSGYTKSSVSITGNATVNVYPDGALFWHGNGDASGDSLFSKCGGFAGAAYKNALFGDDYSLNAPSVSPATNSTTFTLSAGTGRHAGSVWMATGITIPTGATIKAKIGGGANGLYRYADLTVSKVTPYTPDPATPSIGTITGSVQTLSKDLTAYGGESRLFVVTLGYYSAAGYTSITATLEALWLETT